MVARKVRRPCFFVPPQPAIQQYDERLELRKGGVCDGVR